jgi:Icc-related predicted phosphoesterase
MGTLKAWGADVIRIVCISDTHSMEMRGHISVPEGDVLIHAGDFSSTGRLEECQSFRNWMNSLPHKQKIIIAGNHDITMQKDYYAQHGAKMFHPRFFSNASFDVNEYATRSRDIVATGSTGYTYLEDSECKLVDPNTTTETALSVYGSPWQPEFYDWAYNLPRGISLKEKWDMIPTTTDVLITHGPPHGILDKAADGVLCGCRELLTAVKTRVKPRLHIFGHIHEGYGKQMCYSHSARFSAVYCCRVCVAGNIPPRSGPIPCTLYSLPITYPLPFGPVGTHFDGTTLFVNPTTCTLRYRPTNPPIVIDFPLDPNLPAVVVEGFVQETTLEVGHD